ncbi:MAG: DUF1707 domain-containing protein [Streptosporangiales bacterium]|nr:DUF1707 domain-containing protein [Streptosporangiales bacterium]
MRASDADRERVLELLRDAAADGRIGLDEHEERVTAAATARTLGELADLTTDLAVPGDQPVRAEGGPVMALGRVEERSGRWVVPEKLPAVAIFGRARLDLTSALLQRRHVTVVSTLFLGTLELTVPEGVEVRIRTRGPHLSRDVRVRPVKRGRGAPPPPAQPVVVEILGWSLLGSIRARSPKPRRRRFFGRG